MQINKKEKVKQCYFVAFDIIQWKVQIGPLGPFCCFVYCNISRNPRTYHHHHFVYCLEEVILAHKTFLLQSLFKLRISFDVKINKSEWNSYYITLTSLCKCLYRIT